MDSATLESAVITAFQLNDVPLEKFCALEQKILAMQKEFAKHLEGIVDIRPNNNQLACLTLTIIHVSDFYMRLLLQVGTGLGKSILEFMLVIYFCKTFP